MTGHRVADQTEDGVIAIAVLLALLFVAWMAWSGRLRGMEWPAPTEEPPAYGWLDPQGNPPPQALLDELGGAALREQPYSKYPLSKAKAALYARGYAFRAVGGGVR